MQNSTMLSIQVYGLREKVIYRYEFLLPVETSDWMSKIKSVGQRQKIDVTRLTLQARVESENKPCMVLMLDEIFAGLNKESIDIIKAMLDREFLDTQIFVIDHEAEAHNKDGWYDNRLQYRNNGTTAELLGASAFDSTAKAEVI